MCMCVLLNSCTSNADFPLGIECFSCLILTVEISIILLLHGDLLVFMMEENETKCMPEAGISIDVNHRN